MFLDFQYATAHKQGTLEFMQAHLWLEAMIACAICRHLVNMRISALVHVQPSSSITDFSSGASASSSAWLVQFDSTEPGLK